MGGSTDRLVIARVPALIGAGVPLFGPGPRDISLRHVATRYHKGGLAQTEYEIGVEASNSQGAIVDDTGRS